MRLARGVDAPPVHDADRDDVQERDRDDEERQRDAVEEHEDRVEHDQEAVEGGRREAARHERRDLVVDPDARADLARVALREVGHGKPQDVPLKNSLAVLRASFVSRRSR
jgi:hypothetical protein